MNIEEQMKLEGTIDSLVNQLNVLCQLFGRVEQITGHVRKEIEKLDTDEIILNARAAVHEREYLLEELKSGKTP